MAPTTTEQQRSVEEAVSYSVGHRIRMEILACSTKALSAPPNCRLTRQPLTTISHHIKELVNSRSIELARIEKVRNTDQHFYRAIELPLVSDEEAEALPAEVKQEYAALILQAITAEGLGALWAGKLHSDPCVRMMWRWFTLDRQGRQELADEQKASWDRIVEIEARATNRRAKSDEAPVTMIASRWASSAAGPWGLVLLPFAALPQGNTE